MAIKQPATRPDNSRFSSGPCAKPPTWNLNALSNAWLGRSHRAIGGKTKLADAISQTRQVLNIPKDYKVGIVPASDTGAFEMAMWSMLGARPAEMVAWESFGSGWVSDVLKQLKIEATEHTAEYGEIVDMARLNFNNDVCFTWNGTTSGVCLPSGDFIPDNRVGLTLCDATSAAFAVELPWEKLDATTFSWQKVLGGEAAHGVLILSPRAVERLESYTPSWPLPKIFRLTKNGKLIDAIFTGATINTPSMLCVEDYLFALDWAESIGGLAGLIGRAQANAQAVWDFCSSRHWIANLAIDDDTRSVTSVCLKFTDNRIEDPSAFAKAIAKRMDEQGVAFDVGAYRDAPAGLRIWCGATVETADIKAMLPWLEWAYLIELEAQ
jgi:phosphoserine aminotransferase